MKYISYAIVLSALLSCKNDQQKYAQGPQEYPVVEVVQKTVIGFDEYPVTIQGTNNNEVRAKIQGYIKKVFVDEGQVVNAGTPLFQLETNILSQSADAARAAVEAGESNIKAAQAAVKIAEVEVNKLKPLVEKDIIGEVQLRTAEANLARAEAALTQAIAAKGQAGSNLRGIQENINFSMVKSPIRGTVGTLLFREGSLVGPSDPMPLTTVSETSSVYAYFSMNEKEYLDFLDRSPGNTVKEKLKNIPEIELILANGQVYTEKGKVEAVTGQIDKSTGSIQFRATFANSRGLLSNGNSGKVRIPKTFENATVFPEMSVFDRQGNNYVMIIAKDTARQARVNIVNTTDNLVVVDGGVKPGDMVVVQGAVNLQEGTPVKAKKQDLDQVLSTIQTRF